MSWELFRSIVDQVPDIERAVLHGVGEPMLVKNLPKMVRYLKDRGTYVLFNTNGMVLNDKNGRALIEAGLDELRATFGPGFARGRERQNSSAKGRQQALGQGAHRLSLCFECLP